MWDGGPAHGAHGPAQRGCGYGDPPHSPVTVLPPGEWAWLHGAISSPATQWWPHTHRDHVVYDMYNQGSHGHGKSWKIMEKIVMEKSWHCFFSWLWQLSSLWLSCMLWDTIITISETMWEWESWKKANQSWKTHGILFSDFCGNPDNACDATISYSIQHHPVFWYCGWSTWIHGSSMAAAAHTLMLYVAQVLGTDTYCLAGSFGILFTGGISY